jgi:hypothetical protein
MSSKAVMLAKIVKLATAWREANSSKTIGTSQRQQQKRPITTRMSEIVETSQQ